MTKQAKKETTCQYWHVSHVRWSWYKCVQSCFSFPFKETCFSESHGWEIPSAKTRQRQTHGAVHNGHNNVAKQVCPLATENNQYKICWFLHNVRLCPCVTCFGRSKENKMYLLFKEEWMFITLHYLPSKSESDMLMHMWKYDHIMSEFTQFCCLN